VAERRERSPVLETPGRHERGVLQGQGWCTSLLIRILDRSGDLVPWVRFNLVLTIVRNASCLVLFQTPPLIFRR
jgi:hypothetical protein